MTKACQDCGAALPEPKDHPERYEKRRWCRVCAPHHAHRPRLPRAVCARPGCGTAVKQARDTYCSKSCAQQVIARPEYRQRVQAERQAADARLVALLAGLPAHGRHGRRLTLEDDRQLRYALAADLSRPWSQQVGVPPRHLTPVQRVRRNERERESSRIRAAARRAARKASAVLEHAA